MRIMAFIDGFNLYHAVKDLRQPHLKWLDLRKLRQRALTTNERGNLTDVYYFSAYAEWRRDACKKHRNYVAALEQVGIHPILGRYKNNHTRCNTCGTKTSRHEEKETDVNIAIWLVREALLDHYDMALLVTGDTDLVPAAKMVKEQYPGEIIRIVGPPKRRLSKDLLRAAASMNFQKMLTLKDLRNSLLPETMLDPDGTIAATRPDDYPPPS
jgi:uncharacterized LabA/DUF88 family protein